MPERARHKNRGIRKLCECPRRTWPKCPHPWHFNYKHGGHHFRFSLERRIGAIVRGEDGTWQRDRATLGEPITSKSEAQDEAERLRIGIREGTIIKGNGPVLATLTLGELLDEYDRRKLALERAPSALQHTRYQMAVIRRTVLTLPDGSGTRPFGEWFVSDIKTPAIMEFKEARLKVGLFTANRQLGILRACFNWAIRVGYLESTPFKRGTETVVTLSKEPSRHRRLENGEGDQLLAACGPHLRAVVEAALETGCRLGEILSMQWHQLRFTPRPELVLPAGKTKTKRERRIPISTRLRAILEMRRTGPDGVEHPPHAYVFGNELGQRIGRVTRAWEAAVLRAHGYTPKCLKKGKGLTVESRAHLRAINLHFHDLRREAGSRWLEGGVPLHTVRDWLGHTSIAQTSTYLSSTAAGSHDAMRAFEERTGRVCNAVATGGETEGQSAPVGEMTANRNPQEITGRQH